jgi:hypothetical protein
MEKIFIYSFLAYGITNIVVFGSIFNGWRKFWEKYNPKFFGKLFGCPMCFGFWVGFGLSLVFKFYSMKTPMTFYGFDNLELSLFFDACFTSGVVWFIHTIQEWFER